MKKSVLIGLAVSLLFMMESPARGQHFSVIQQEIQAKGAKWEAGETSISSLLPAEQKMRLGSIKSPGRGHGKILTSVTPPQALPYSIDWRNNGGNYVSGVRNQGNCGSCWAFSATAALESAMMISQKQPNIDLNLSEQVALSCSGAGDCESGGYPEYVSNFLRDTGLPAEDCYPYTATDGNCSTACGNWQASAYKIKSWSWVVADGETPSTDTIKGALVDHGPLLITMAVYTDFFSYKRGVYKHVTGNLAGNHAILLVGYDDTDQCFIVKNSWGTGWGESGFFRIAYSESTGDSQFGYETIAYQNDSPSQSCDVAVSKLFTSAGGTGSIRVTPAEGCTWHATSSATWITITSGASGTGPGTVQYTVAPTTEASSRTGTITIEGQTHTLTQAGATTVSPRAARRVR